MSYQLMSSLLTKSLRSMAHTDRYATFRKNHRESVAEHSFFVATFVMVVLEEIREKEPEWWNTQVEVEKNLDPYRCLSKALSHDMEERMTGDLILNFKNYSDSLEETLFSISMQISNDVFRVEGYPDSVQELCETAKDYSANLIEASIVDLADLMSVAQYRIEEAEMGNKQAALDLKDNFLVSLRKYIKTLHENKVPQTIINYYKDLLKVTKLKVANVVSDNNVYLGQFPVVKTE